MMLLGNFRIILASYFSSLRSSLGRLEFIIISSLVCFLSLSVLLLIYIVVGDITHNSSAVSSISSNLVFDQERGGTILECTMKTAGLAEKVACLANKVSKDGTKA